MIATDSFSRLFLRVVAPLVWRTDGRIATKLAGFAATEFGSALDMLKAAELTDDPKLRRLFFRHAMDEARHAQLFHQHARQLGVGAGHARSDYNLIRATRQNLFEKYGLVRFVAFVYLAERRGELQFRSYQAHFRARPDLASLFARIGKDERFHVAYSRKLLDDWRAQGRRFEVFRALAQIRATRALEAWRRHGRIFGDWMTRILLALLYLIVLPLFAIVERRVRPERRGWKSAEPTGAPGLRAQLPPARPSLEWARRQY